MSSSTMELMNKGIKCLRDNLGDIETEEFIAVIMREKFDYTKWRQNLFKGLGIDEINAEAVQYEEDHPFKPLKVANT